MAHSIRGLHLRRGTWWFQPPMVSGVRPKEFSLETSDEGEAVVAALARLQDPEIHAPESWVHEVEAYIEEKVLRQKLSRSFARTRRVTLLDFGKRYAIKRPERVTADLVKRYYLEMRKRGLKENTAQGYIFSLRAFLGWLVENHRLRTNVAAKIEMERLTRFYRHKVCTKPEVDALIENCDRDDLKFALLCGFDAGMRRNEISEAVPAWFATAGIVHLTNSADYELKDGEARHIPLTKRFRQFLAHYGKPEPFMLHPEISRGEAWYRYDIRRPWKDYVTALSKRPLEAFGKKPHDFTWVTIQTMRHTFASLRVQKGVSIYKVAKWLGDGVEVVQRHYGHLSPGRDKDIEI